MPEPPTETTGSPIKEFVSRSIKEINDSLPDNYSLMSNIDFDLSVIAQKTKKGKVDLKVLGLDGNVSSQNIQRVKFSVGDPKRAEQQIKTLFKSIKEMAEESEKSKKK